MSSIFHRLDELERVQREILAAISGQESGDFSTEKARKYPKGDENARSATHSHEMHPKVTYSELVVDDVPNKDTLVERVARVIAAASSFESHWEDWQIEAQAAILEIADALDERYCGEFGTIGPSVWLRSQVEP